MKLHKEKRIIWAMSVGMLLLIGVAIALLVSISPSDSRLDQKAHSLIFDAPTWTGSGADNLASTPGNWDNDWVPNTGEWVVINTGSKNITWDIAKTFSGFTVNSSYTGTITPTVDFGTTGPFVPCRAGSIFIAGPYNYTIGGDWTGSPGTMTIGTATLIFTGSGAHTLKVSGTASGKIGNISIPDGGTVTLSVTGVFIYMGSTTLHPVISGANGAVLSLATGKMIYLWPGGTTGQPFSGSGTVTGGGSIRINSDHTHIPTIFSAGSWTFAVGLIFNADVAYTTTIALGSDIVTTVGISTLGEANGNITLDTAGYDITTSAWTWSWASTSTHTIMLRDSVITLTSASWGWNTSYATLIANTSTIILAGVGVIHTNTGSSFYNLAINGVFTTKSSINVSHVLTIGTGGTLNIPTGKTLAFCISNLEPETKYRILINDDKAFFRDSTTAGEMIFSYDGAFSLYYLHLSEVSPAGFMAWGIIFPFLAIGMLLLTIGTMVTLSRKDELDSKTVIILVIGLVIMIGMLTALYGVLA